MTVREAARREAKHRGQTTSLVNQCLQILDFALDCVRRRIAALATPQELRAGMSPPSG